ncbi:hypothetical protein [Tsukamurella soli]
MESTLKHRDDGVLHTAVLTAIKLPFNKSDPDSRWKWGRRDMSIDISPLVASTMALHAFSVGRPVKKRSGKVFYA